MPTTVKRKVKRRDNPASLSPHQIMHLLCGYDYGPDELPFNDDDHRKALWSRYRKYLIQLARKYEGKLVPDMGGIVLAPDEGRLPAAYYHYETPGGIPTDVIGNPSYGVFNDSGPCTYYAKIWGQAE